ncbi:hypothetical protein OM076_10720 [Solirubrobacter ginsenosidimutans]|uniref:Uncharacterized protein n=1 Tax=Solirubrobacter ginsenosidimutans TaxID=490573 RepID=A0A9X3S4M3_9ACTN|nr:hypothetical protein [Solirubrobacter ginsenosidimutans]MDA0160738.1 hypothetical protein [Solirubrobacter ginsenosidimutans]
MSPLTPTNITRATRRLVAALAGTAMIAAAPAAASAHEPIRLHFEKQCLGTSCTGTLLTPSGKPIPTTTVSASLSPMWVESGVIGFSATETITARNGSFTMNHLGINDLKATPDEISVLGAVVIGSWQGVPLAGATVFIRAYGDPLPSVRGTIWIQPPRNGH